MTLLSPAILPSSNLMQDVPCLALVLGAIALYLHACETGKLRDGLIAAVLFGLATLTKWNALTGIAELAWISLLFAPSRRWLLLTAVPVAMFGGWELFLYATAGESHFMHHFAVESGARTARNLNMLLPLVTISAAVAPAIPVLASARSKHPLAAALACIAAYGAGFLLIALEPQLANPLTGKPLSFRIDSAVLISLGALMLGVLALLAAEEVRYAFHARTQAPSGEGRVVLFLLGWLAIELAGYFALSPFPAVRRVLGPVVALTIVLAHFAARGPSARRVAWLAAATSIAFGLLYQTVDTLAAFTCKHAADDAYAFVRAREPSRPIWFTGVHGFEFYATQHGMKPAIPDVAQLSPGDFLVIHGMPDMPLDHQMQYPLDLTKLRLEKRIDYGDSIPFTTYVCYYNGRRPIQHQDGPRTAVWIYRVTAPFVPQRVPPPADMAMVPG